VGRPALRISRPYADHATQRKEISKMSKPKIEGGYILLARKITISDIMKKPPLYMKLWVWMLESANRKNGYRGLERGQFFTTKNDMREAMSWMVGYRKVTPSEKEIRNPYEWFLKGSMIVAKKVTHGTLVTICNYDEYQNPKNYEGQSEGQNENPTKGERGAKYKQEVKEIQEDNKDICDSNESPEQLSLIPEPVKLDKCPQSEILKLWAQVLPDLPQPRIWKGNRPVLLRARWNEDKERQNLEWWESFFKFLRNSDFFMGKVHQPGRKPFVGRIDWLLKSENFMKTYEGNYHE